MASTSDFVKRPLEGLSAERDLVAMRQLIPAATMTAKASPDFGGGDVLIASILPMNWPSLKRDDGTVLLGMQATLPGNDLSRGLGQALKQALEAEPGTSFAQVALEEDSPRLQDVLDPDGFAPIQVHDDFEFWLDAGAERTEQLTKGLEEANAAIMTTRAVPGLDHAFWVDTGSKLHLRWVVDADEDQVIDAIARLHSRRESSLGDGTKYVGSFRADGLTVPVWDLSSGMSAQDVAEGAQQFASRFEEARAVTEPLTALERRARGAIVARQVTLR